VTSIVLYLSLALGMGSLVWGFYEFGYTRPALWLLGFGLLWGLAQWRRWNWFASLGLAVAVIVAAIGLWIAVPAGWMIAGVVGALIAWDLSDFARRLRLASRDDSLRNLEGAHLMRATILAVLGVFLGSIAMLVRVHFTFEWALLLAFVSAVGISQLVSWLRRGGP
jgi:hypothetical protein